MDTASVIGTTNTTPNLSVTNQLQAFLIFSVAMLVLGSFQKTHMLAVWIMGIVSLVIVIKWANGGYAQSSTGATS